MRNDNIKIGGLFSFYDLPSDMKRYIRHFGLHFNAKLYKFAVSKMRRKVSGSTHTEKIQPIEKQNLQELLQKYGITLEYDKLYDGVYVYSMAMSDFYETSLPTEKEVIKYVKDLVDDVDQVDGFLFNRWVADMYLKGEIIDWDELI